MSYQVLARTHRPTTFDQVIGQESISRTLVGAITEDRVAHAYLFCGSRGVGKTSMARIFARALNCAEGPTATPCDACDACTSIASGRDVDFIEVDGASNRGIDEIRNIRDNVRYKPAHARFKIYLIDEVHMLTGPAFNALLKTLEEPPAHVKFFFATTEPYDVPGTIRSRCQRFDFRRIPPVTIAAHLDRVAQDVGIEVAPEALTELARSARGSMRDALVRLDQVRAFTGGMVGAEDVHQVLGTIPLTALTDWAKALAAGDVPGLFERIGSLYEAGADLEAFLVQWIEFLRDLLVVKSCGVKEELLAVALGEPELAQLAQPFSFGALTGMVGMFLETSTRLRKSSLPRVLLEVAFVRAALWDEWIPASAVAAALEGKPPSDSAGAAPFRRREPVVTAPQPTPAVEAPAPIARATVAPEAANKPAPQSKPVTKPVTKPLAETPPAPEAPAPQTGPLEQEHLSRSWSQIVTLLNETLPAFAPILRKGQPTVADGGIRVVFDGAENNFALQKLSEDEGQMERVAQAIQQVMGQRWRVKLALGEGVSETRNKNDISEDAYVRAALEIFEGRVLEVRAARKD